MSSRILLALCCLSVVAAAGVTITLSSPCVEFDGDRYLPGAGDRKSVTLEVINSTHFWLSYEFHAVHKDRLRLLSELHITRQRRPFNTDPRLGVSMDLCLMTDAPNTCAAQLRARDSTSQRRVVRFHDHDADGPNYALTDPVPGTRLFAWATDVDGAAMHSMCRAIGTVSVEDLASERVIAEREWDPAAYQKAREDLEKNPPRGPPLPAARRNFTQYVEDWNGRHPNGMSDPATRDPAAEEDNSEKASQEPEMEDTQDQSVSDDVDMFKAAESNAAAAARAAEAPAEPVAAAAPVAEVAADAGAPGKQEKAESKESPIAHSCFKCGAKYDIFWLEDIPGRKDGMTLLGYCYKCGQGQFEESFPYCGQCAGNEDCVPCDNRECLRNKKTIERETGQQQPDYPRRGCMLSASQAKDLFKKLGRMTCFACARRPLKPVDELEPMLCESGCGQVIPCDRDRVSQVGGGDLKSGKCPGLVFASACQVERSCEKCKSYYEANYPQGTDEEISHKKQHLARVAEDSDKDEVRYKEQVERQKTLESKKNELRAPGPADEAASALGQGKKTELDNKHVPTPDGPASPKPSPAPEAPPQAQTGAGVLDLTVEEAEAAIKSRDKEDSDVQVVEQKPVTASKQRAKKRLKRACGEEDADTGSVVADEAPAAPKTGSSSSRRATVEAASKRSASIPPVREPVPVPAAKEEEKKKKSPLDTHLILQVLSDERDRVQQVFACLPGDDPRYNKLRSLLTKEFTVNRRNAKDFSVDEMKNLQEILATNTVFFSAKQLAGNAALLAQEFLDYDPTQRFLRFSTEVPSVEELRAGAQWVTLHVPHRFSIWFGPMLARKKATTIYAETPCMKTGCPECESHYEDEQYVGYKDVVELSAPTTRYVKGELPKCKGPSDKDVKISERMVTLCRHYAQKTERYLAKCREKKNAAAPASASPAPAAAAKKTSGAKRKA